MLTNDISLISILIPTFNSGKSLEITLQSIAGQTFKSVEVVVMDGGSTDDTLKIADTFKPSIQGLKIFSEKDQGIYDAMNKAMDKATGKWLIFMGSDDCFHSPNVLHELSGIISKTKAKVVYGNARIIGDTGWAKDGDIYDGPFDLPKLLNKNICHQAMFYNREFIQKEIGYFSLEYKKSSDWDYNLRCWAKRPFKFVDMIIADFAAGGFSTNSTDTHIVDDFVDNVLSYFKIDLFHPLVNTPTFIFFPMVKEKQKTDYPIRFTFEKLKKRIIKKLKRS